MHFEIYRNAPIVEAAIDIRVRTAEDVDLDVLSTIRDPQYPEVSSEPFKLQVQLEWGNKPKEDLSSPLGYFSRSPDHKQVLQARRDGFTFNRLAPYQSWEVFGAEAKRLWDIYRSRVPVEVIEAVGLTYMNEILIPFDKNVEEYLNAYVHLPEALPQQVASFSLSFSRSLGSDGLLHVAEGVGPVRKDGHLTVGLFIQAIKFMGPENEWISEDELWGLIERLRAAKSAAFEACITDKVREAIR